MESRLFEFHFVLQKVFEFFNTTSTKYLTEKPEYNYNRIGHPDDFVIGKKEVKCQKTLVTRILGDKNAEDQLTMDFPKLSASKKTQYQEMMKSSDQIPMCMSSSGSVFSDLVSLILKKTKINVRKHKKVDH